MRCVPGQSLGTSNTRSRGTDRRLVLASSGRKSHDFRYVMWVVYFQGVALLSLNVLQLNLRVWQLFR